MAVVYSGYPHSIIGVLTAVIHYGVLVTIASRNCRTMDAGFTRVGSHVSRIACIIPTAAVPARTLVAARMIGGIVLVIIKSVAVIPQVGMHSHVGEAIDGTRTKPYRKAQWIDRPGRSQSEKI